MVKDEGIKVNRNEALTGFGIGAVLYGVLRYLDPSLAQIWGYTPTQYAIDLRQKYTLAAADQALSDAQLGEKIMAGTASNASSGLTFAAVIGTNTPNLAGPAGLTANRDTYRAAVGQKLPTYMMLSGLPSVAIGGLMYYMAERSKKMSGAFKIAGGSIAGSALLRSSGMFEPKAYPSGFDIKTAPVMQALSPGALDSVRQLSARNNQLSGEVSRLQNEINSLRSAANNMKISEILPGRAPGDIRQKQYMMGNSGMNRITGEYIKHNTGLQVLGVK